MSGSANSPSAKYGNVAPSNTAHVSPPPVQTSEYLTYQQPWTRGTITPLILGRSGPFPFTDSTEPLDAMQSTVASLQRGDAVYLSAWLFIPSTPLTAGPVGSSVTWGQLLASQAANGVVVRILLNDFDPAVAGLANRLWGECLPPLDELVMAMPASMRNNLKYIVARHPANIGIIKGAIAKQGFRSVYIASYHQKFMVARRSGDLTAFCGGVDISPEKTPGAWWATDGGTGFGVPDVWTDLHFKLEGPIAYDLEKEFVMRWNLGRGASRRAPLMGWRGYEARTLTPPSSSTSAAANTLHAVHMLRTISDDGGLLATFSTKLTDIEQAYKAGISSATKYIYLENQYFRSSDLADWLVAQGKAQPNLVVIIVVVEDPSRDDGSNPVTAYGDHLQFQFFDKVVKGVGSRVRVFTMKGRYVHAKLVMVDDAWMCAGSANANVRSFRMDSELNFQSNTPSLVAEFRARLWAWSLGESESTIRQWAASDFLSKWDAVASANAGSDLRLMTGEGVVVQQFWRRQGKDNMFISDAFVQNDLKELDVSPPSFAAGGMAGPGAPDGTTTDPDAGSSSSSGVA